MTTLYILRMVADLAFYAAFAGMFAMKGGGSGAFAGILIQSCCYGLSSYGKEWRALRLLMLLPMISTVFLYTGPDLVMLLPSAAYTLWLVWQGDYALSRERQQQIFSLFCKVLPIFTILSMIMWSAREATTVTLPYGLIMLCASVLLMRALRHDPSIYRSKRYQLSNLASVAAVVAGAYLISSKAVMDAAAALFKSFYDHVIWPLLELFLRLLFGVMSAFGWLFAWLRSLFKGEPIAREIPPMDLSGLQGLAGDSIIPGEASSLAETLGRVALTAIITVILILFFRWLKGRYGHSQNGAMAEERRIPLTELPGENGEHEDTAVRSVRKQYRKFLKWCAELGAVRTAASTSLDMHHQVESLHGPDGVSKQIRALYIRARYAGKAETADAQQMKKLCSEAKKMSK